MERPLKDIPTIDLEAMHSQEAYEQAIRVFSAACEDIGFCYVSGHGVSAEMWVDAYAFSKKFFDLPASVKQAYAYPEIAYQRGWTPPAAERAVESSKADAKESLFFGSETVDGDLMRQFPRHYHENIWPREIPELRGITRDLYQQLLRCGERCSSLLSDALGYSRDHVSRLLAGAPHCLRYISYPAVTDETAGRMVWGGEHTDINFLTILPPSTADGPMIRTRSGAWIPGRAPRGCVTVQVCDELEYITGGTFLSARHRVDAPDMPSKGRLSVAFFVHLRSNVNMTLAPFFAKRCRTPGRYRPILAGKFVDRRLEEIGLARARYEMEKKP